MKAYLMHRDRDFDLEAELPPHHEALTQDLELERVLATMADGDEFLLEVARRGVLLSLTDPAAIEYRQAILRDCLEQPAIVRELYDLAVEAIVSERRNYFGLISVSPDTILHRSLEVLEMFVEMLKRLRRLADEHREAFRSDGFTTLFAMLAGELGDEYFVTVDEHLRELRFRHGELISAELGGGTKGKHYVLRRRHKQSWLARLPLGERSTYTYRVPERDMAGMDALSELRGRGVNLVANALAQSNDHILGFFRMLRAELGFYVGAANLHRALTEKGEPLCFPAPADGDTAAFSCCGLYDVSLSLGVPERVVGNDVDAGGASLVMITGANQGGKSTFLRSAGLAQLMLQCGLFVGAETFGADIRHGVFTHFKREEDATMKSGKLDEELSRMSDIVDGMGPRGMLLCNESFAATNEREGSELARQLTGALRDAGVKVFFVTHMFDLAHGLYSSRGDDALFLRAERLQDGGRTFRVVPGEPLPTSYGEDLYRRIFGALPAAAEAGS
jgi:hypothetical protein